MDSSPHEILPWRAYISKVQELEFWGLAGEMPCSAQFSGKGDFPMEIRELSSLFSKLKPRFFFILGLWF
jgi:hypothetical protein